MRPSDGLLGSGAGLYDESESVRGSNGTGVATSHYGLVPEELSHGYLAQPARGVTLQADEVVKSAIGFSNEFPPQPPAFEGSWVGGVASAEHRPHAEKGSPGVEFSDQSISSSGSFLAQKLLEVLPLRSKLTGRESTSALLPLPTSRDVLLRLWPEIPQALLLRGFWLFACR